MAVSILDTTAKNWAISQLLGFGNKDLKDNEFSPEKCTTVSLMMLQERIANMRRERCDHAVRSDWASEWTYAGDKFVKDGQTKVEEGAALRGEPSTDMLFAIEGLVKKALQNRDPKELTVSWRDRLGS